MFFTDRSSLLPFTRLPKPHDPAHQDQQPLLPSSWNQDHGYMAITNTALSFLTQVLQGCRSHHWICLLYRAELATNAEMLGITLVSNTAPR